MVVQEVSNEDLYFERYGIESPDHDHRPEVAPISAKAACSAILRLDLLGSPCAALAGIPIVLRTRKTLGLLAYLAVEQGQHPREQLADLLWPDADVEDARASLRTTLSYVRQALGSESERILKASRDSVSLHASAPLDLDVQALADAQRLIRQSSGDVIARQQLENTVSRYRGLFLSGVTLPDAPQFETWIEGQRAHWLGVEAELLARLAEIQTRDGDVAAAIVTLEPLDQDKPGRGIGLAPPHRNASSGRRQVRGPTRMESLSGDPRRSRCGTG